MEERGVFSIKRGGTDHKVGTKERREKRKGKDSIKKENMLGK